VPIMTDKNLLKNQASLMVIFQVMICTHHIFSMQISITYKNGSVNGVMYKRTIIIMKMNYQHVIL
jgi:hypothetical protein